MRCPLRSVSIFFLIVAFRGLHLGMPFRQTVTPSVLLFSFVV
jgi:hypothetical protein